MPEKKRGSAYATSSVPVDRSRMEIPQASSPSQQKATRSPAGSHAAGVGESNERSFRDFEDVETRQASAASHAKGAKIRWKSGPGDGALFEAPDRSVGRELQNGRAGYDLAISG